MAIAKVIEVLSEGATIEAAVEAGVKDAAKTIREIKNVYIDGIQAIIENNEVAKYRVNAKVTFVVD